MARRKHDDSKGKAFFGAITRNLKTVFIGEHIKTVREKIAKQGVTGNNVAIFKCFLDGRKVKKKLTHKPAFRLETPHHVVFEKACHDFLKVRVKA